MWCSWYSENNSGIEERLIHYVLAFLFTAAKAHRVPGEKNIDSRRA